METWNEKHILSVIPILSTTPLVAAPFRTSQFVMTMSKYKQLVLNESHLSTYIMGWILCFNWVHSVGYTEFSLRFGIKVLLHDEIIMNERQSVGYVCVAKAERFPLRISTTVLRQRVCVIDVYISRY